MEQEKQLLYDAIVNEVFVSREKMLEAYIYATANSDTWLFDFRKIFLQPKYLDAISSIFLKEMGEISFQVGGLETASIPFVSGVVMKAFQTGKIINGFFIRKSRKKGGLLQQIEGSLTNQPVVLVDDLINRGFSILQQVKLLEQLGKRVIAVFTVLQYRDISYYEELLHRGIKIKSIFTLDDFKSVLPVQNLKDTVKTPPPQPFKQEWYFKSNKAAYEYVIPKSTPVCDEEKIYVGSDSGNFWALDKKTGEVVWSYLVRFGDVKKRIFSSPLIHKDAVYFGAYDGNVYALNRKTGKPLWIYRDADWVGSSPVLNKGDGYLYIGLEFGLINKKGGIVCLDINSGKRVWSYSMSGLTHATPVYSQKLNLVVCGCNNGFVYAFEAKGGKRVWSFKTNGEVKMAATFNEEKEQVIFCSFDGNAYVVDAKTGILQYILETKEAIYASPFYSNGCIFIASLDKCIYAFDALTGGKIWVRETKARIFTNPTIIQGSLYVGNNEGKLYELSPKTGEVLSFFQATERITSPPIFDDSTGLFYLSTYANEIYCLRKLG